MEKSKYGMPPPKTRREFEHNLFLLAEGTHLIVENRNDDYSGFFCKQNKEKFN